MTTRELIEHLETLPQDATVIYTFCSDWSALDADEIDVANMRRTGGPGGMHFMDPGDYRLRGQTVSFEEIVECVRFPGN